MRKELVHVFTPTNFRTKSLKSESRTDLVSSSDDDLSGENSSASCLSQWARSAFQKKNLYRKLPILIWLPEYNLTKFIADIIAGITLGLTTIPQVLGVSSVGQIPPEYGLYSAFVGCFIYIFLGSTKYVTIGPTVTSAIITLSYTKGQPPEFSVLLCFLTGIVTLLLSFLQLGFIVDFISTPVISGFTSAAAISIAATQVKGLLGITYSANGFIEEVTGIVENISDSQWKDSLVAFISLTSLYTMMKIQDIFKYFGDFSPQFNKFLWFVATSRNVAVVVISTAIVSSYGDDPPVVGVVGEVPSGMPPFKLPPFDFSEDRNGTVVEFSLGSALREKTSALIVIPLIAFMEHITIAKAFAGTGKIDANQELLCMGVANLIGSFFSSIPVTGAFGRTALNQASGAQSPLGGFLTGSIVILALVVLTPQFYYIPKPTLNSVVVMAVIFMVDLDIVKSIWRSKRMDLFPWLVTFLVSLFVGLEYGIMSGFSVSTLFLLYYAARPGVKVSKCQTGAGTDFLCVEIDRSMTFPSVDYVRYTVMKGAKNWGSLDSVIVLDCQSIQLSDYTSAKGICDLIKLFRAKEQELILFQVKRSVKEIWDNVMSRNGVSECIYCANEAELEEFLQRNNEKLAKKAKAEVSVEMNNNAASPDEDIQSNN